MKVKKIYEAIGSADGEEEPIGIWESLEEAKCFFCNNTPSFFCPDCDDYVYSVEIRERPIGFDKKIERLDSDGTPEWSDSCSREVCNFIWERGLNEAEDAFAEWGVPM